MESLIELRKKAKTLKPIINIGKNGLTEGVISEIENMLKKKKLVKIKMTRGALEDKEKKEVAKELLIKTKAELIDFVGFNITLYKASKYNSKDD